MCADQEIHFGCSYYMVIGGSGLTYVCNPPDFSKSDGLTGNVVLNNLEMRLISPEILIY